MFRATTSDFSGSDGLSSLSHLHPDSVDRLLALEKLLQEWRTRSLPTRTFSGGNADAATIGQTDGVLAVLVPSVYGIEHREDVQPETDGEGRVAGGSVENMIVSGASDCPHDSVAADGSGTLPPSYSSHRSET